MTTGSEVPGRLRLELRDLVVHRRKQRVVAIERLDAATGTTIVAGANGSGKSTLLSALSGMIDLQGTRRLVNGSDLLPLLPDRVAYLPQAPSGLEHLRVADAVAYASALHTSPETAAPDQISSTLDTVGIAHLATRRIGRLSGGERLLAYLACTVHTSCDVVLLDEPTAGLDARHRQCVLDAVGRLSNDHVVVITTHHPLDIATIGGHIVVLRHGVGVFDGTVDELVSRYAPDAPDQPSRIEAALASIESTS